jgi:hypothetical protein
MKGRAGFELELPITETWVSFGQGIDKIVEFQRIQRINKMNTYIQATTPR